MTGDAGPVAALVNEFGDWEVALRPAGLKVATAYKQSSDGRHRRFIVAPNPAELLDALRRAAEADVTP